MRSGNLSERDGRSIWHPLTQHGSNPDILPIAKARGVWLYDEEGNGYIDAISSWYCSMYGHSHPHITKAVTRQLETLDHVVFSGFTHEPAVQLSELLLSVLPENQARVFYSDNGSTATEVGLKMALQYFHNRGEKRQVLMAFEHGFHGDTFGAMSVSGLSVYNGPFEKHFIEVERIPEPTSGNIEMVLSKLEDRLKTNDVAAFIYEPLVQGAAAMRMVGPEHLEALLRMFHQYNVITIADEVMTGFGKTGTTFASEQLPTKPDIICLSKALTGGTTPLGATSCTAKLFDAFYSSDTAKGLFHGHTYTANPLACTAALAATELLQSKEVQEGITRIAKSHHAFEEKMKAWPMVKSTRHLGVIFALDLDLDITRYGPERDRLYRSFLDRGVFLRPLGNTIYLVPPYIISESELSTIYTAIENILEEL